MTSLHFELPRALILSANSREHWRPKANKTRNLRALAAIVARQETPLERAHLLVRVGWPDNRRRDVANIEPTLKALIDGCVDGGLLPDDDDDHLIGPDKRAYVAGMTGFVVLDFEFTGIVA
jgi:hypothetical protein